MNPPERAAVVGGAGFIGLHVCHELRARGIAPWILDSFAHGEASRHAAFREAVAPIVGDIGVPGGLPPRIAEVDARNVDKTEAALAGHELVINLATINVRASLRSPLFAAAEIGAIGAVVPFACAAAGVRRYVYVSSSEVYGEATEGPLTELTLPRPCTVYGAGKLAGEHYAEVARLRHGMEVVVVRPFNAYGPGCHIAGDAGEAIPRWIAQAARGEVVTVHGDGRQTRDYTYVEDIARGIVDAALSDAAVNTGPVNLCSGVERSAENVAADIGDLHGPPWNTICGEARPCDLRRQVGCAARAATLLGWSPRVPWEEGLRRTREDVLARLEGVHVPERTWT